MWIVWGLVGRVVITTRSPDTSEATSLAASN
jgi:hypothetical protein